MNSFVKHSITPFTIATLALVSTNCNDSNFRGSSGKKSSTPVNPVGSTPPKECVKLEESRSLNLALVVDNSGSNIRDSFNPRLPGSDCVLNNPTDRECKEATKRELAALAAFNVLTENEKTYESLKGKNKFAVIKFPEEGESSMNLYRATAAISSDWASITDQLPDMSFTRKPEGATPLKKALELTADSMKEAQIIDNGNSNLVVVISDGGATDPEPVIADELRKLFPAGTKFAVYMLIEAAKITTWLSDHAKYMRSTRVFSGEDGERKIEIVTGGNDSKKSLAYQLADKDLYFEGSADDLVKTVQSLVSVATDCK